ncbi:MAG: transposase [Chloroflexi bacterium]|nr:transposase [Chloroflexota bacterium]
MINYCLAQTPPQTGGGLEGCRHMVIDGTFIHRPQSLVALMDANTHRLIAGKYAVSESSWPQLQAFLSPLIKRGLRPRSFTIDGNPGLMKALRALWPGIILQRCLIHIQRQGLSWCRTQPKTAYARQLRRSSLTSPVSTPRKSGMRSSNSWLIGNSDTDQRLAPGRKPATFLAISNEPEVCLLEHCLICSITLMILKSQYQPTASRATSPGLKHVTANTGV